MINIKKGAKRIVCILPLLHIVIKLPRFYLSQFFSKLLKYCLDREYRDTVKIQNTQNKTNTNYFYKLTKKLLLTGIISNKIEYNFWRKTHHDFLTPTYFSLLGLLNIQKHVNILSLLNITVKQKTHLGGIIRNIITKNIKKTDYIKSLPISHHILNIENFGILNKEIVLCDYGETEVINMLKEVGQKIFIEINETIQHYI